MPRMPGSHVGPYEIDALIGSGGMGEVYRARDTKLDRDVALKILPDAFTHDAERLARFRREAKVLASLNHPNIAAIHGLEDSGETHALVLELVEGFTLADRIAQGPIPIEEARPIAKQIADALEAAHEQGVIHRDLKPANIKLRSDGTVKVLDFGLAKVLEGERAPADQAHSPTLTAAASQMGAIMGTAAYMSPEQARGGPLDRRTDIWAFGCVLFEMLTGHAAFGRPTTTDTLAAVIEREPEWDRLPARTPESVRILLRRCIEKDLRQRLPHIGAARLELTRSTQDELSPRAESTGRRWRLSLVAAAGIGLAAAGLAWVAMNLADPMRPTPSVSRVSVNPAPGETWVISPHDPDFAVSPDGQLIAYVGRRGNESRLIVRRLDEFEGTDLGTFGGALRSPFFSPTGDWIGFVDGNVLRRVAVEDGEAGVICELPAYVSGAAWGPDETVIFGVWFDGLYQVPSNGGVPVSLTSSDQPLVSYRWPSILPGGESVLFAAVPIVGPSSIWIRALASGDERLLIENATFPRYAPTGHLLYVTDGALWAVGFDAEQSTMVGDPVRVIEDILIKGVEGGVGAADVGIGGDGTLVYRPATSAGGGTSTLVWVDQEGREEPLAFRPRAYGRMALSPDGSALAIEVTADDDPNPDIWVGDIDGSGLTRLTFSRARDVYPVWTADGGHLLFASTRVGSVSNVYRKSIDGRSEAEALFPISPTLARTPYFVAPDNGHIGYLEGRSDGSAAYRELSLEGERADRVIPLVYGFVPALSPDGRWLAYISQETGDFEVYVQPYPNAGGTQWRITQSGGRDPAWSHDGRHLFYQSDTTMYSVAITTEPTFAAGPPVALFEGPYADSVGRWYAVGSDGRFLMLKLGWLSAGQEAPLNVVLNWSQELVARTPVP